MTDPTAASLPPFLSAPSAPPQLVAPEDRPIPEAALEAWAEDPDYVPLDPADIPGLEEVGGRVIHFAGAIEKGQQVEQVRRWPGPRSPREAEWAAEILARAEARDAELVAEREYYLARVWDWYEKESAPARRTAGFFRGHLERWAIGERTDDHKTIRVPSASIATRAAGAQVVVEDMDAVVAWAKTVGGAVGEIVRVKEDLLVSELRRFVSAVEILDELVLDCGCRIDAGPFRSDDPQVGARLVICPECRLGEPVVVGREGHYEARDNSPEQAPVPGVGIKPPETTASVTVDGNLPPRLI